MSKQPKISVIVPAYNEAENLEPLTTEISAAITPLTLPFEVIIIDDGSTDNTREVLQSLQQKFPQVRPLYHANNHGQSAGQATGFKIARGEILVTMDADQQNDPADIPRLIAALTDDIDCVCGVRRVRHDTAIRRLSSKLANGFRNALTGDTVTDAGCTFRAIKKDALHEIPVFNGMHRFLPTLLTAQGYFTEEIDVNHRPRTRGTSKYGINNRLWRGIRDCFAIRWYKARAIKAHRIADV